jgi:hypothetical protein
MASMALPFMRAAANTSVLCAGDGVHPIQHPVLLLASGT